MSESVLGSAQPALSEWLRDLDRSSVVRRLWDRDHSLWSPDSGEIRDRLGWLGVASGMRSALAEIRAFAAGLCEAGVRDVVLLGMGGSSLAPEVFRSTFGSAPGHPRLHVLDSTSPAWIRRVTSAIDPSTLHVLVASKSGGTVEVETLVAHFVDVVRRSETGPAGGRFSAITDPGTPLDQRAARDGFHTVFRNPPDIGGRFSALSYFGLVPAGLLGVDLDALLNAARRMQDACGPGVPAAENPGAVLGAFLGGAARDGRDKLGLLMSPSIASLGLWIEQLLAESTGKSGRGILPVTDEPAVEPGAMGRDRVFVAIALAGEAGSPAVERAKALGDAGHPVLHLTLPDRSAIGAEMFRWEFATAVAGHVLGVHPFDQPDVQSTKTRTAAVLDALERGESPPAVATADPESALSELRAGGYVALQVYGDPHEELRRALEQWRSSLQRRWGVPTTLGIGPRFLHSTGQLHKGGPKGGVFLQLVLDEESLPIPGRSLDFAQLIRAQADGDYAALHERGRRVVRVDAGADPVATVRAFVGRET